jgi:S-methylmethionine-dependent homocysteine/selenocysteine methylase
MEEINFEDIEQAILAIKNNDTSLPLEFYPNEMYTDEPSNEWDMYENEKFKKNWKRCVKHWQKTLSKARRILKIERERLKNPLYCKKAR